MNDKSHDEIQKRNKNPFPRLKNDNPFVVPDNYFEKFNGKLIERLKKPVSRTGVKSGTYKLLKYGWAMGVAAVIAGLLLAVQVWI